MFCNVGVCSRKVIPIPSEICQLSLGQLMPVAHTNLGNLHDVAVEYPHSRVIEIELDHEVSVWLDQLRISSLRVARVDNRSVPSAQAFREDLHVMSMDVHRVRCRETDTVHDNADRCVCAHVVDCSLRWEVEVVDLCL